MSLCQSFVPFVGLGQTHQRTSKSTATWIARRLPRHQVSWIAALPLRKIWWNGTMNTTVENSLNTSLNDRTGFWPCEEHSRLLWLSSFILSMFNHRWWRHIHGPFERSSSYSAIRIQCRLHKAHCGQRITPLFDQHLVHTSQQKSPHSMRLSIFRHVQLGSEFPSRTDLAYSGFVFCNAAPEHEQSMFKVWMIWGNDFFDSEPWS